MGIVTVLMSSEGRRVPDCLLPSTPSGEDTAYPSKVEPYPSHMDDAR